MSFCILFWAYSEEKNQLVTNVLIVCHVIDPINSPGLFLASEFARSNRCVLFRIAHELIFCDSILWTKEHEISIRGFLF